MIGRPNIDVVVLSRELSELPGEVAAGIREQVGVRLAAHRVAGPPRPEDPNRWATIARARRAGARLGHAPWLLFLDDDVRLAPDTIVRLWQGLRDNPNYAALAADYLGESGLATHTPHVAMGATLFRRSALNLVAFRWTHDRCECRCCCDDLRRLGFGIRYWPAARAWHLRRADKHEHTSEPPPAAAERRILVAFDRRHYDKFRRRFLTTLRRSGNHERVAAVAYGLYPSERAVLSALPGIDVFPVGGTGPMPPIRRLVDFQNVLERLPPATPVAYWDAGDVHFQGSLAPLWETVRTHPDKLLAVREPRGYPRNPAVAAWTLSIGDREWRQRVFRLMETRPFLNSGFAAGTADTLLQYLREAHRLRHGRELRGSSDWGDQMALNLYCHLEPDRWLEVEEGWNYCIHDRLRGEVLIGPDSRLVSARGTPVYVVHGNAHSLRRMELLGFGRG